MHNRRSTFCMTKVEDGFAFPSNKSSLNFLIVCVERVIVKLQSFCEGFWAQALVPHFVPKPESTKKLESFSEFFDGVKPLKNRDFQSVKN